MFQGYCETLTLRPRSSTAGHSDPGQRHQAVEHQGDVGGGHYDGSLTRGHRHQSGGGGHRDPQAGCQTKDQLSQMNYK